MLDTIVCCLILVCIYLVGIIIWCIKEQRNIFETLYDFFYEWWQVLKTIIPPLILLIIFFYGLFH